MALMLRDELESRGIAVVMTRETGTASNVYGEDVNSDGRTILDGQQHGDRDELQKRINICNDANADILISLHLNGFDDPAARGYEVLYTSSRSSGTRTSISRRRSIARSGLLTTRSGSRRRRAARRTTSGP